MTALPLLDDGSCSIQNSCLEKPSEVWERCPQTFKCGTCVAWSPRERNRSTRNNGQCMLDRNNTQYLDCNAPICPYYRPRAGSDAAEAWASRPVEVRQEEVRKRTGTMTREAPPPSTEAVARGAFQGHPEAVAAVGAQVLAGHLSAQWPEGIPPLLERFRGGTASVAGPGIDTRQLAVEGVWARVVLLRGAMARLDEALEGSNLPDDVKAKVGKDLGGIAGSMTTFNLLFARKDDGFKGTGKGD